MKKYLSIFAMMIFAFVLSACEVNTTMIFDDNSTTETTLELIESSEATTLESIDFSFGDFNGEGSLEKPFVLNITVEETFTKVINFHVLDSPLVYEEGIILGDTFYAITDTSLKGLDLDGSNDFSLEVTGNTLGVFYIKIDSQNSLPTYLRVNVEPYQIDFTKNLKVLAIGNSFSVDGTEYLYKIAKDYGIPNIVLGILYIPGASLEKHVDSITNNLNDYVYYKNTNDSWFYQDSSSTLLEGLQDEKWDVIIIQQVSGLSGIPSTYTSDVDTIINYVNANKTNEIAEIGWQMTWAYSEDSTHPDFSRYSNDQLTMYHAITSTVQTNILIRDDIEIVIPSGTTIQNIRTSFIGDNLNRDGYHLSMDKGRYAAGLTWFLQITGFSIDGITYKPENITGIELLVIKEAVNNAVLEPYSITQSTYTEE